MCISLHEHIFIHCMKQFYNISVQEFQEKIDNIRRKNIELRAIELNSESRTHKELYNYIKLMR